MWFIPWPEFGVQVWLVDVFIFLEPVLQAPNTPNLTSLDFILHVLFVKALKMVFLIKIPPQCNNATLDTMLAQ